MKTLLKLFLTLLISSHGFSQYPRLSVGAGIGNQYAILGGGRIAMLVTKKLEPSASFGYTGLGHETTFGLTYYFKNYYPQYHVNFYDKKFEWPSGLTFGANYYKKLSDELGKGWGNEDFGMTMLIFYKLKPKGLFGMTNTPIYERRFGFGATYIFGRPTELAILPSFMFGIDFRVPFRRAE